MPADIHAASRCYADFLRALGLEDAVDVAESARHVSEFMAQWTQSVHDPRPALACIKTQASQSWVRLEKIPFYTLCAHHFVPFWGTAHIAYIPQSKIAGFGGFVRIIEHYCRRPQMQETLCEQIADAIEDDLKPLALKVHLKARQMCLEMRGRGRGIVIKTETVRGDAQTFV